MHMFVMFPATTTISTTTVKPPPKDINDANKVNPPYKADESKPLTAGGSVNLRENMPLLVFVSCLALLQRLQY